MVFPVIVLDSSFLVSLYLPFDDNTERADKLFEKFSGETFMLPNLILYETLGVLNIKDSLPSSKEAYEELVQNKQIRIYHFSQAELDDIITWFFENGRGLSVPDSAVIFLASKLGADVLTFDKEMQKRLTKKLSG